jgi:hypothetical protein
MTFEEFACQYVLTRAAAIGNTSGGPDATAMVQKARAAWDLIQEMKSELHRAPRLDDYINRVDS